jgi:HAD superfamily 5'-nucleotidase-like hydrolase
MTRTHGHSKRRTVPRPRLRSQDIPHSARVFVNRNLKMTGVRVIGFDMDHTLAIYHPDEFERLAFEAAQRKLVERKGYPEEVLSFPYEHQFVIRGLVVDKEHGNVLKMDRHHYVSRVYHGRTLLSSGERRELYQSKKIPLSVPRFASVDTLFSLPEVALYARLVDFCDRKSRPVDYARLYDDVRECVDLSHQDGSIKDVIQAAPERYVRPDENLPLTLDKFRRHAKKLFLLTNSEPEYTNVVMGVLLSGKLPRYDSWRDYFDVIMVSSRKPQFFVSGEPFRHAEGKDLSTPVPPSARVKFLAGGNATAFEERIGARGDEILYFGDHTYGDILRSKSTLGWRTAMILSELEQEIEASRLAERYAREALNAERSLDRLLSDRDLLEIELASLERKLAEGVGIGPDRDRLKESVAELKEGLRELERRIRRSERRLEASSEAGEAIFNPYWGPIFKNGTVQSRFAAQLTRFACIYTSRASNFFYYPVRKFFRPHRELMPHDLV